MARTVDVVRDGRTWPTLARFRVRQLGVSTLVWLFFISLMGLLVVSGWAEAYPTEPERVALARSVEGNPAFEALFGRARALETPGGFAIWRAAVFTSLLAGVWGLLTATRLTRAEEESGLAELVLAGAVTRRGVLGATLFALGCGVALMWALPFGAYLLSSEMGVRDAAFAAAPNAGAAALFAALGLVTAQVFGASRKARSAGTAVLVGLLLVRVVSGVEAVSWLEWASPFGWVNLLVSDEGYHALPIALFFATAVVLAAIALALGASRQFQHATVAAEDTVAGTPRPVRTLAAVNRRAIAPGVASWGAVGGGLMLVMGLMTRDIMNVLEEAAGLVELLEGTGFPALDRPEGFVGVAMTFAVLITTLYAASAVSSIRDEEASERLEALLVRPVGRVRWLLGRVVAGIAGIVTVSGIAPIAAWLGTALVGNPLDVREVWLGGVNLVPISLLFFGIGVLGFGVWPRMSAPVAYGAIIGSYTLVWIAAFVDVPEWLVDAMPFTHVEAVPAVDPAWGAAGVMLAAGVACVALALPLFRRRDLVGH